MGNEVIIRSSKKKIFLLLLLSIGFVIGGGWIIFGQGSDQRALFVLIVGGIGTIIFFGFGIYVFTQQLFNNKGRLIIDDNGLIYDARNPVDCFLDWNEIHCIKIRNIRAQKIIQIQVKNPDLLIDRQKSRLKKRLMRFNQNIYGTPVCVITHGLKISSNDLMDLLTNRLLNRKLKSTNTKK